MAELDYLRSELARVEADGISNGVLVPLPYIRRLIVALEDRERLRAAGWSLARAWGLFIEEWGDDPFAPRTAGWKREQFLAAIAELRAALEGRDG